VELELVQQECWQIDCRPVVIAVQQRSQELARYIGLDSRDCTAVAIAVSELAHNIITHAHHGRMLLQILRQGARRAFSAEASDDGPGIVDLDWALRDFCSTAGGLGCGLPAAKRLMDEFRIDSTPGKGTVVAVRKWGDRTSVR
jgi:serine/threonine-protein kinase RsbT